MTWGYNQYSIHSACLKKEKDIIKLILGVGFKLSLKRLKKCFLTPIFVMILTHLGSKFICWSIFAYGLLFVELFAWCKSLCGVMYTAKSSSAESLTTRKQAQRCKWHHRVDSLVSTTLTVLRSRNYLFSVLAPPFFLLLAPAPAIHCHFKMYLQYYNSRTIRNMSRWRYKLVFLHPIASSTLTSVSIY